FPEGWKIEIEAKEKAHTMAPFKAYELKYQRAVAVAGLVYSTQKQKLHTGNGIEFEDVPAVENLWKIFGDHGLPMPDEDFASSSLGEGAPVLDLDGIAKDLRYQSLTTHFATFVQNFKGLEELSRDLRGAIGLEEIDAQSSYLDPTILRWSEPTFTTEEEKAKKSQSTGAAAVDLPSGNPSAGSSFVEPKMGSYLGARGASNSTQANLSGPFGLQDEEMRFSAGNKSYRIVFTKGDGACALHALLGDNTTTGVYYYPDARRALATKLLSNLHISSISELWESWMVKFVKDYLGNNPSAYTKMVFGKIPGLIGELKARLTELDKKQDAEQKAPQKKLFEQACQLEGAEGDVLQRITGVPLDNLRSDPELRYNKFTESLDEIIHSLRGNKIGRDLGRNLDLQNEFQTRREELYKEFIQTKRKEVLSAYLQGIANASYYFSTQEIELAARLFEKRVTVYSQNNEGLPKLSLEVNNETAYPEVVIFHKGIHFSRCEERSQ
ncbi:MAG TPA: OTU domain-containing protein, partial [Rhabdochlamydiaceae bacterium]